MAKSDPHRITWQITPRRVGFVLLGTMTGLVLAYIATKGLWYFISYEDTFGLYRLFDFGQEANLPSYLSALNLLFAGFLLAIIARIQFRSGASFGKHWAGLAIGFLLMSLDEAAQLHEGVVGKFIGTFIQGEGIWSYVWYIVYIPLASIIAAIYVPFLRHLPTRFELGFVAAGALYVGGAIGLEMIEAFLDDNDAGYGWLSLSILFEEGCEMLGVVLFNYMLLAFIAEIGVSLQLNVVTDDLTQDILNSPRK